MHNSAAGNVLVQFNLLKKIKDKTNEKMNKEIDKFFDKILALQADLGVTDIDGNTYNAVKIGI